MGDKVDAYRAKVSKLAADDPIRAMAVAVGNELHTKHRPGDVFTMADEVMHLRGLKSVVAAAVEAINEQLDFRVDTLYELMLGTEMQSFSRKGQSFYQTTQRYCQAKKELGGTSNPDLVQWLEDNELGDIAKRNVNAQSLRSSVNEWLEHHPVEAVIDGDYAHGPKLLEALGITAEELVAREAERERLINLVNITEKQTVGIRKA